MTESNIFEGTVWIQADKDISVFASNSKRASTGEPVSLCESTKCRKNEKCEIISGQPVCVSVSESTCWAQGDPHYHTFDGKNFDFMGTCTYTIAKTCTLKQTLPSFSIEAKNDNRGNTHVSYTGFVTVRVYNIIITVVRSEIGLVRVNNQQSQLPISLHEGKLKVYQSGSSVLIETDFSLRVSYDWNSYLVVKISSSFSESICGLCGNFNGDPNDDFSKPDGNLAPSPVEFGRSWKVEDGDKFCWDDCKGECKSCPPEKAKKYKAEPFCGWISKRGSGPFSQCHSVIDPKVFLDNCVYDLCLNDGFKIFLCNALKNYADTCKRKGVAVSNWRTPTGCPLFCPENSQYKACGSPCPATCNDQVGPKNCSSLPCVETCQCNEGFVLDAGKCIPKMSCGCAFEGNLFSPGEQFWGDDTCTKKCICDPKTRKVTCQTASCLPGEKCQVQDGIQNCYPTGYGKGSSSGDPHYISFDGQKFDFMGTCIYQFSGLCEKRNILKDFLVLVQNDHRGSQSVSFTRAVEINAYSTAIVISREYPGKVMVNGFLINLPYRIGNNKISIYKRGQEAVVQTNFFLTVTFDWQSRMTMKVPNAYAGALCGLGGNFNGKKEDDMAMRDSSLAPNPTAFGQSWKLRDVLGCTEVDKGGCPGLSDLEKSQRGLGRECGLILNKSGPFRECHSKVDPEGYFQDCVYDYCFFKGQQTVICQVIASYAAACQAAGATLHAWRSNTFCKNHLFESYLCHTYSRLWHVILHFLPTYVFSLHCFKLTGLPCGQNSHYELCATDCVRSCASIYIPVPCTAKCQESCVCDENFVQSGDQCVPMSQCGCYHQDRYYLAGEAFHPTCQERCVCQGGGAVQCEAFTCGPNEECKLSDGIQKCYPIGSATCSVSGSTHYLSFDGLPFDFHGTCTYTLAKSSTGNKNLIPFTVNVENGAWRDGKVSVPKMVSVHVYGMTLTFLRDKQGQVKTPSCDSRPALLCQIILLNREMFCFLQVDNTFHLLPVTLAGGQLKAYQQGMKFLIQTDFGLIVSYDQVYQVKVTVPGNYQGQMGGLCGNYNDQNDDEFLLPDGKPVTDVTAFGTAWKVSVPGTGGSCSDGCPGNKCPVCEERKKAIFKQDNYCGVLLLEDGPFGDCQVTVDPEVYFNNCIYDVCLANGDSDVLCQSIESYVSACQDAEVYLDPWRSQSFCPLSCPTNSHYEFCADVCSTTCAKITDPGTCPAICAEGCQCDDGFFFDGHGCINAENCGCFKNGRYFKPNEKVLMNECQERCTCIPLQGLTCEAHSCTADEKCKIQDGVMGCINKDPCKDMQCRAKETCKIENDQVKCIPDYHKPAWGWGDPHYHMFDGWNFDFHGTCTYTFAKYCGNDPTLVPFTIDEKNDNRGSQAISYIHLTNIYVYGYKISMYKQENGKVRINDVSASLPLTLEGGKIKLYQSGSSALLQTDFGLQVSYDWNWYLIITLSSSYYGAMCGLAGNFNEDPGDDMTFPNGTKATSIVSWARSWKVKDRDPFCWDECKGNCPTCSENHKQLYGNEKFCGMINKTSQGPFKKCHTKVNPNDFFDGCVYDVCLSGGAKNILCQALEAYAKTCRKAGATVDDWRTSSGCALPCPENSHYEACGNACPASCSDRTAPAACKEPCLETCQCNDGFVLSVDKCVPIGSCGCTYNGFYYKPKEEFWADKICGSRCKCDPTLGMVVCKKAGCKDKERCAVVNGVRDCYPISKATCTAAGDPHYTTFDGKKYDFMGTCIYQLAGLCSEDPTLKPFTVNVQNNHRGNTKISFTKVVTVVVYNITITVSQEHPRRVQVNDVFVNLPFYLEDKIKVYISGVRTFIKTNFDLTVTFDWYSYAKIIVPSTYTNAICGLCGSYNSNPNDDLVMKDGKQAASIAQFAESWKVAEVPGCSAGCTNDCPVCEEAKIQTYKGDQYCGILIKKDGPFRECHKTINPTRLFDDCVFDTCQYHGRRDIPCDAISNYVADCQALGIPVEKWRSDSFCSPTCSSNSHYDICGNGCPATCHGLSAPRDCEVSCREGCYCNTGFLLSGDQCVPIGECGCVHQDKYYKKGEVFYPGASCQKRCSCTDNRVVECQKISCRAHEECRVQNGVQGCHAVGCGKCTVSRGSHYLTFDRQDYDFQGTCTYTLAELKKADSQLEKFSVLVENGLSLTKMVVISFHGYTAVIERAMKWKVKVNGEVFTLPMSTNDRKLWVNQEGNNIIVQSDFGLKVLYDASAYVLVSVPSTYWGHMNGLCGNFNGDSTDDFTLPNGKSTQIVDEFGMSWKVPVPGVSCSDGCGKKCPVCDTTKTAPYQPVTSCGMILAKSGPFKGCHSLVDPLEYFSHCLYDMCVSNGAGETLCQSIQAYVAACQAAGATIGAWRTDTFCSLSCPSHSHYELCSRSCDFTCSSLSTSRQCTKKCFEGCQCDNGYLFDGASCVAMENCGCIYDGRYIKIGESVVLEGCMKTCTCQALGQLICKDTSCREGEICALNNGVRACMKKKGECLLTPGARLTTFDGTSGEIPHNGAYEVVSLCNEEDPSWFRIIAVTQKCSAGDLASVSTLHVFFQGALITVKKNRETWINGYQVQLPAKAFDDVSISVTQDGVVIDLASAVQVLFRPQGEVKVQVEKSLKGKLCASCGNFNGNAADDLTLPNGKEAGNLDEVIHAWEAKDFSRCYV
ncbi:IgGFc-binding protein-like [Hemicordylus capensis]|uniref:IgGFc-binding protein-like n=1 Tax=Hemicordylus capensis TaxID=884348 RepID=UPI0023024CE5|nr:IgGFc-binding protein-like [Hemicordylus capensis]